MTKSLAQAALMSLFIALAPVVPIIGIPGIFLTVLIFWMLEYR